MPNEERGSRPAYIVRGREKVGENVRWFNIGAAWTFQMRDGTEALSVRLQALPINFDGNFALIPYRQE